jgi:hypothetical protein
MVLISLDIFVVYDVCYLHMSMFFLYLQVLLLFIL